MGDSEEVVSSLTSCASPRGPSPAGAAGPPSAMGVLQCAFRLAGRSPLRSPLCHSNSWRRRPPSPRSLRSPCRRRPSSRSIAAWCRSSTTRTGYALPRPEAPRLPALLPALGRPPGGVRVSPRGAWLSPRASAFPSEKRDLCRLPRAHTGLSGSGRGGPAWTAAGLWDAVWKCRRQVGGGPQGPVDWKVEVGRIGQAAWHSCRRNSCRGEDDMMLLLRTITANVKRTAPTCSGPGSLRSSPGRLGTATVSM